MSLQRECLSAWLTLPLPLQRGQGAPAREPIISSEEHKQLMLFYHRRQEELKVAIEWQGRQQSWGASCLLFLPQARPSTIHTVPGKAFWLSKAVSSVRLWGVPLLAGAFWSGRK